MKLVEDRETIIELEPQELEFLANLHKSAYRFDEHVKDRTPIELCLGDRIGGHTNYQIRLKHFPKTSKIALRTWTRK